jgi:predicted amidophosphoribosyltransferase
MNRDPNDCFEGTEPSTRRHQIDMLSAQEDWPECDECGAPVYDDLAWCEDCMAKADEEPTVLMEENDGNG